MKFVTDTHSFLWYLQDHPRLGDSCKRLFDRASGDGQIIIPAIVLAELLYISRKKTLPLAFDKIMNFLEREKRFSTFPLTGDVIQKAIPFKSLEMHDALIVATALHLDLPLMTQDGEIQEAKVVRIL